MNPPDRAAALRALAGVIRCSSSLREALSEWPDRISPATRAELLPAARRARLGLPLPDALAALKVGFGEDAELVAGSLGLGIRGADAARLAERLASTIEDREAARASGLVASSGARLSGRLVAALPLAFVPLASANGAPLFDGPGMFTTGLGLTLLILGLAWLRRLVPRVSESESAATRLAAATADLLNSGLGLTPSLQVGVQLVGGDGVTRALRLSRLGLPWARALEETGDPELSRLAAVIRNCQRAGVPAAASLNELVRHTRAEQKRAFDRARRRAPVLMVLPLSLCVLPAFVFLAVAPLLRSFAWSS